MKITTLLCMYYFYYQYIYCLREFMFAYVSFLDKVTKGANPAINLVLRLNWSIEFELVCMIGWD